MSHLAQYNHVQSKYISCYTKSEPHSSQHSALIAHQDQSTDGKKRNFIIQEKRMAQLNKKADLFEILHQNNGVISSVMAIWCSPDEQAGGQKHIYNK